MSIIDNPLPLDPFPDFQGKFRFEWQTFSLIIMVYGGLAGLVWFHQSLPWWVLLICGTYLATLHSSLEHEVLHGHPTPYRFVNEALAWLSPNFWLPFGRYRDTHLSHHQDENLTDPLLDPESYYFHPNAWQDLALWQRIILRLNQRLVGRLVIGPIVSQVRQIYGDCQLIFKKRNGRVLRQWLMFLGSCSVSYYLIAVVAGMNFWLYYILIAYPAIGLALNRSYAEHRAHPDVAARTIIIEAGPLWSLLYLNNNLHVVHHLYPHLPWYKLPSLYWGYREEFNAYNQGYSFASYAEIFYRYGFQAKESIIYPKLDWLKSEHPKIIAKM